MLLLKAVQFIDKYARLMFLASPHILKLSELLLVALIQYLGALFRSVHSPLEIRVPGRLFAKVLNISLEMRQQTLEISLSISFTLSLYKLDIADTHLVIA